MPAVPLSLAQALVSPPRGANLSWSAGSCSPQARTPSTTADPEDVMTPMKVNLFTKGLAFELEGSATFSTGSPWGSSTAGSTPAGAGTGMGANAEWRSPAGSMASPASATSLTEAPKKIDVPAKALQWGLCVGAEFAEEDPGGVSSHSGGGFGGSSPCFGGLAAWLPRSLPPPPPPPSLGTLSAALGFTVGAALGLPTSGGRCVPGGSPKPLLSLEAAFPAASPSPLATSPTGSFMPPTAVRYHEPCDASLLGLVTAPQAPAPEPPIVKPAGLVSRGAWEESGVSTYGSPTTSQVSSDGSSDQESQAAQGAGAQTPGGSLAGSAAGPPPGLELPGGSLAKRGQALPSAGSALHFAGGCRPCAWFWKDVGCQNALTCTYCHLCDEGALKAKKKNKLCVKRLGVETPKTPTTNMSAEGQCTTPNAQAKFSLSLASLI